MRLLNATIIISIINFNLPGKSKARVVCMRSKIFVNFFMFFHIKFKFDGCYFTEIVFIKKEGLLSALFFMK